MLCGGCGFIGSNFVNMALNKGDEVLVYDNLTYAGHKESLPIDKIQFVEGDIANYHLIEKTIREFKPDVVINFAAETHVDRSLSGFKSVGKFLHSNSYGVYILAVACYKYNTYLHLINTDEVFGDIQENDPPFTEDSQFKPNNPYSVAKATGDLLLRSFARTNPNFKYTISYCTNNYGPYQSPEKLLPRAILKVMNGEKVPIYTDVNGNVGLNRRDWIFVDDHCEAIYQIINSNKYGEKYCIAGKQELSNIQLIEILLKQMGKQNWEDWVQAVQDRPGHDFRYALTINKITNELGWTPKVKIEDGLKRTVDWYLGAGKKWVNSISRIGNEVRKGQDKKI